MRPLTRRSIAVLLLPGLWLWSGVPALGQGTIAVYRCTDAQGRVSVQDTPCPAGAQQEARTLTRPQEPPPSAAPLPAPTSEPAPTPPPDLAYAPPPPPPLWECEDYEGHTRISRDGEPQGRWVPLWVVGLDPRAPVQTFGRVGAPKPTPPSSAPGVPNVPASVAFANQPLIYVEDVCYRLAPETACARLADERDELRRRIFNSQPSGKAKLEPEERELTAILRESCARS